MNSNTDSIVVSPVENALIAGDLIYMSESERLLYYRRVCESLGLNPLTKPFSYIKAQGKLLLYANKDGTNQLRSLKRVSIESCTTKIESGLCIVECTVSTPDGRRDTDIGCVPVQGLSGEALGNALMKAVTKAKRRATLSICGLGWLDESEIDSFPTTRIEEKLQPQLVSTEQKRLPLRQVRAVPVSTSPLLEAKRAEIGKKLDRLKWASEQVKACLVNNFNVELLIQLSEEQLSSLDAYIKVFDESTTLIKNLGWSPEQGKVFLQQHYEKDVRPELTFHELLEFVEHLKDYSDYSAEPEIAGSEK
jgi:hypothetical protein